jgi:hypothetical protein
MAELYSLMKYAVNGAAPTPISGQLLAHNSWDLIHRAFIGADLKLGARIPENLTVVQCALLARTNRTYVQWALKRPEQRAAIEAGLLPLVPPVTAKPVPFIKTDDVIPDAVIADVIRKAGITRTIDIAAQIEAAE